MSDTKEPSSSEENPTEQPADGKSPTATPKKPVMMAAEKRGPIRNGLESLGMAVLMAVLLKYFLLEAYVIPTPSMQPTMMGSPEAGESDRILVDKLYYMLHEPKRWDIAVFRYPVRQVQSYVKRIVGIGGDRLKIAGGNLYNISKDGKTQTILRKPARIQRTLWREMYPMRRKLELFGTTTDTDSVPEKGDVFGRHFRGRREQFWKIDPDDGAFIGTPTSGNTLRLSYNEVRNNYTDGYDLAVADILRKERTDTGTLAVTDLAIEFELTPTNKPDNVKVEIEISPLGVTFALEVANGQGRLKAVRTTMPAKTVQSELFPFEIAAGATTSIRFEHLDDRLIAYRDGDLIQDLDTDDIPIVADITTNAEIAKETEAVLGKVVPRITVVGKGSSKFGEVTIERDLHYTHSFLENDYIIEVPEGHFFMMGDNTLGSADGRDWTAIKIGVDDKGNIVDPDDPANSGARVLWGNKRPKAFGSADDPHDDDNPVPMETRDRVVFVDEMGEIHSLHGKVDTKGWANQFGTFPRGRVQFMIGSGPGARSFTPKQKPARFVPRSHIQGRPVARFLRSLSRFKITSWIR
jgi:signal peptidase I